MPLIARLRIILNDVDPLVMRQVEVPLKIRLDRLHEVVQAAVGWTDSHLWEFRAGGASWGVPDPDGFYDGPMPAKNTTLQKLIEETGTRTMQYIYDFGDDWDHSIRIEQMNEAIADMTYPRLLKASGACPPEDVGGAPGYEAFLAAIADPGHPEHADMAAWYGATFDAEDPETERITDRLAQLARKWAPKTRKTKAPG